MKFDIFYLIFDTFDFLVDEFDGFVRGFNRDGVTLRYLFEYEPLSTAGGVFHYRDQITRGLQDSDTESEK